jgi:D-hydroxyproline dehydrogenase subunit alpha
VVGAGPAGIAAAASAAAAGRSVIVIDEAPHAGGQVWRHHAGGSARARRPRAARRWLARLDASGATLMPGWSVVDAHADPTGAPFRLLLERGVAASVVIAEQVILAMGARERFLPFPGWTLPGVMGIGGMQALLASGLRVTGRRVVLAGSGPLLLPAAAALSRAGALVVEVAEQAERRAVLRFAASLWRTPARLLYAAACRGAFGRAPYSTGTWVVRAGTADAGTASTADMAGPLGRVVLTDGVRTRAVHCDILCTGYGLVPSTELARLLGCAIEDGCVAVDDEQRTTVPGVSCAGEMTGVAGVDAALVEGEIAGIVAAGGAPAPALLHRRAAQDAFAGALATAFAPRAALRDRVTPGTVVCRCEDVCRHDVGQCGSAREAKVVTRAGMGPCQARVCGPAMTYLFGWDESSVRTPVLPARVGTLIHSSAAARRGEGS